MLCTFDWSIVTDISKVNVYQSRRRSFPTDLNLQQYRCDNLKYRILDFLFLIDFTILDLKSSLHRPNW